MGGGLHATPGSTATKRLRLLRKPVRVGPNVDHRHGPDFLQLGDQFQQERRRSFYRPVGRRSLFTSASKPDANNTAPPLPQTSSSQHFSMTAAVHGLRSLRPGSAEPLIQPQPRRDGEEVPRKTSGSNPHADGERGAGSRSSAPFAP
jgi:hypothetical protein